MLFLCLFDDGFLLRGIFSKNANKITGNRRLELEGFGEPEQFVQLSRPVLVLLSSSFFDDALFLAVRELTELVEDLHLYVLSRSRRDSLLPDSSHLR